MFAATTGRRNKGFTLIEVLIVVVIMAVLAATIIPQFSSSAEDAKRSTLLFNLNQFRSQIELYKLEHGSDIPVVTTPVGSDPTLEQMYSKTDADGTVNNASGAFGPYVANGRMPDNPLNDSSYVTADAGTTWPPTAATTNGGWIYNTATGEIAANHADHLGD